MPIHRVDSGRCEIKAVIVICRWFFGTEKANKVLFALQWMNMQSSFLCSILQRGRERERV